MRSFGIVNATVVLSEVVLERGSVTVFAGVIQEVQEGGRSAVGADEVIDADGAYLLPGVIDLHNDALEFEVNPRPGAELPLPFAFATLERRLAAAGVTTEFHAISFVNRPTAQRSVSGAAQRAAFVASLLDGPQRAVDHHVLHRIDVWNPDALDDVFTSLANLRVQYVSLNDHTPGQGQYRDVERLIERAQAGGAPSRSQASDPDALRQRMAERAADGETVPGVYRRVRDAAERLPVIMSTHDDDSPEKVDAQQAIGASVCEFPVTVEAAERARHHGMAIVVGAPNFVRGGSQSGNLAASELLACGLADIICADYHAPSLLPAAFQIVRAGLVDLPTAIRMVSLNAARAVGLADRGAIWPGLRADLALVRTDDAGLPHVETSFTAGRRACTFPSSLATRVPVAA